MEENEFKKHHNTNSFPSDFQGEAESEKGMPFSDSDNASSKGIPRLFSEQSYDDTGFAKDPVISEDEPPVSHVIFSGRKRNQKRKSRTYSLPATKKKIYKPKERLMILDLYYRSGLTLKAVSDIVGIHSHTLSCWKKRFEEEGPEGLESSKKSNKGSRLNESAKRAVLLMKRTHPDWGCERIHHSLKRFEGLSASAGAIARLLEENGYESSEVSSKRHPDKKRRFERAKPNDLWQTDMFTFILKRQNRRVHLVAFMDDNSRFITGYGLGASSSGNMVREVFQSAIANYGAPHEILTDNGSQYHSWRGKSAFKKLCEKLGINQIVSKPRRPQTLGKIERYWSTIWNECIESAIFLDLKDARKRIGLFIDYYNFQRVHQGIEGLVPADRFFHAAPQVLSTLSKRVASNASTLAKHGIPRKDVYLAGRIGDVDISLHQEGENLILRKDGQREEVNLKASGKKSEPGEKQQLPKHISVDGYEKEESCYSKSDSPPGVSGFDESMRKLEEELFSDNKGDENDNKNRS